MATVYQAGEGPETPAKSAGIPSVYRDAAGVKSLAYHHCPAPDEYAKNPLYKPAPDTSGMPKTLKRKLSP
jgi:hypothetical protein